jgi:hypothetical protein
MVLASDGAPPAVTRAGLPRSRTQHRTESTPYGLKSEIVDAGPDDTRRSNTMQAWGESSAAFSFGASAPAVW